MIAAVTSSLFVSPHHIGYHLSLSLPSFALFDFLRHNDHHHHWIYVSFSSRQNYICIQTLSPSSRIENVHVYIRSDSVRIILHHRRAMNDVTYSIMTCQRNDHSKERVRFFQSCEGIFGLFLKINKAREREREKPSSDFSLREELRAYVCITRDQNMRRRLTPSFW